MLQINCKLCFDEFNTNNKKPIIICQQNHHLCLECLQHLTPPFICPFCRTTITKDKVRLDQKSFSSLGGNTENPFEFRYIYYRDQLRIVPNCGQNILVNPRSPSKTQNQQDYQTSKKILKILILIFITFTMLNLMIHLFLVFTQQEECIDWDETTNTYTIRQYLKLTILVNIGCFAVTTILYLSNNTFVKGFIENFGKKLIGAYIILRLLSQTVMWTHFMFFLQPECSSFIFLYLHIQTFGYYIFAFLFTISFAYYCIRKQRLVVQQ